MELHKPKLIDKSHYVETTAVKLIRNGIDYAIKFKEPVHIVSDAGFGKSTALYYLCEELGGRYLPIGQAYKSTRNLYQALLKVYDCYTQKVYERELYEQLMRYLSEQRYWQKINNHPLLLVVDEVQTLETTALRELFNIQETSEIALIISGNRSRLAAKADKNSLDQIYSRIGQKIELGYLSKEDCERIAATYGIGNMEAYAAFCNYGIKNSPREYVRLINKSVHMAGSGDRVTSFHIKQAIKMNG